MKKFKLLLLFIIIGILALFFYQNKTYFMAKHILSLEIPFFQIYHFPELQNGILFVAFLLLGLILAYFYSLLERFKTNKTIKSLNATVDSNLEMISSLKNELSVLKTAASTPVPPSDDAKDGGEEKV